MESHPFGVGATFTPSGPDDFYVPQKPAAVVSPLPQRIMPEMPGQIQDSLAALELNGGIHQSRGAWNSSSGKPPNLTAKPRDHGRQPPTQSPASSTKSRTEQRGIDSVFPKLRERTPNVPPSSEEKLAVLEAARLKVLSSPDPEMQLNWAQDALRYVDICLDEERRSQSRRSETTNDRPVAGLVEQQIRKDAVSIVMYLADQYHPRADYIKGMWLEFGRFGHTEDKIEAFRCYKRSAAKGYARAEYRIGMQYESTGENIKALQHYKTGEARGDAASCYRMGMMSLLGQLGQPQDFATAVRLIRQAADAADENAPQGAYVYGMLQARELPQISVPEIFLQPDLANARSYIEKSAYLGFSKAQLKMGSAYELCSLGCEFDPSLSLHYNLLAAKQGEIEAEMSISKWLLCGYHGVFHKNEKLAFDYARRAADGGLATAQFAIGYFYEVGVHVSRDLAQAREWYEKAAQNGNTDARGRIVGLSKSRTLSKADHENEAISRIKSRHGSRRGHRPERSHKPPTPMPSIPDEYLQKPNSPRIGSPGLSNGTAARTSPPQLRSNSSSPYPTDDMPVSVTPYPVDDPVLPVNNRSGPVGGFLNLNLDQRPFSTMLEGRLDSTAARYSPTPTVGTSSPRHDATPSATGPATPMKPEDARREPTPSQRNLPPRVHVDTVSQPPPNMDDQGHGTSVSPIEKLDIGYSAPIDPRAIPLTALTGTGDPKLRRVGARVNGPGVPKSQARLHRNSAPKTSSPLSGRSSLAPTASTLGPGTDSSSETASSRFSFQSLRPPVPPKGPQTFEEMGVPLGKDENDCIIM